MNIDYINANDTINANDAINSINPINPINPNTATMNNATMNNATMNNLLTFSNNYINYLNNSVNYLNNSITYLNNVMYMNNYYNYNHANIDTNNANTSTDANTSNANANASTDTSNANANANNANANANNANATNENNAYLLNYDFDDFIKLSNTNIYALIKSNTIDLYYGNIENPTNDSCAITHEKFSNCDDVTMIKECGHIFNSSAIKQWLIDHQTCPNCRHNILTNSNIISYSDPDNNNKTIFLYTNEFKFYLALHIETLLGNGLRNNEHELHIIL